MEITSTSVVGVSYTSEWNPLEAFHFVNQSKFWQYYILFQVQGFISEAKFITPDINELPAGLKARLSDNNKVLVTMAIAICKQLAECGGSGMSRHKNTILPGLIGTFSDAKVRLKITTTYLYLSVKKFIGKIFRQHNISIISIRYQGKNSSILTDGFFTDRIFRN